jgi:hypothetical protein
MCVCVHYLLTVGFWVLARSVRILHSADFREQSQDGFSSSMDLVQDFLSYCDISLQNPPISPLRTLDESQNSDVKLKEIFFTEEEYNSYSISQYYFAKNLLKNKSNSPKSKPETQLTLPKTALVESITSSLSWDEHKFFLELQSRITNHEQLSPSEKVVFSQLRNQVLMEQAKYRDVMFKEGLLHKEIFLKIHPEIDKYMQVKIRVLYLLSFLKQFTFLHL